MPVKPYRIETSEIPVVSEPMALYNYTRKHTIGSSYIRLLDDTIGLTDEIIAKWLNITTRTFRNYKSEETQLKDNTQEHVVAILSLYNHGIEVFGTKESFEKWLTSENFFLDHKAPMDFLDTITGIRVIDNRLTVMEFGENV